MPTIIRTFSLRTETAGQLDELLARSFTSPELLTLLATRSTAASAEKPELDENFFQPADYSSIYALIKTPAKDAKHWSTHVKERRVPIWENLQYICSHENNAEELFATIKTCQMHNRVKQRYYEAQQKNVVRPPRINASRIADALITLGLEALKEKVARLESERSKRTNGGEGKNKLSVGSRRKTT